MVADYKSPPGHQGACNSNTGLGMLDVKNRPSPLRVRPEPGKGRELGARVRELHKYDKV